ncbi:MAG: DUF1631 domain-containing protein [Gammaproteobacteria bacterium]
MTNVSRLVSSRSADILDECRDLAMKQLPASLKVALDQVDDAMFEIANKADNSNRQNRYFDAMRELRIKRDDFEKDFIDTFGKEFTEAVSTEKKADIDNVSFGNTMELSLIDPDEMEESLAVTNFVENVNSRCREELFGLERRMSLLLSNTELERDEIPLGPRIIGNAFKHACEQLDSDIEVKLTLYKLFDKYTAPGLQNLYGSVNQHLAKRDILPTVSAGHGRHASIKGKTRVIIESETATVEATGEDVFSTLQGLVQGNPSALHGFNMRGTGRGLSATAGGGSGTATGSGNIDFGGAMGRSGSPGAGGFASGSGDGQGTRSSAQIIDTGRFVDTLTLMQQGDFSGLEETILAALPPEELKTTVRAGNVNVLRTLSQSGAIAKVNETDGMTLDIVSILFDYVFDDKAIPDFMKALIGKLQIPVLKVALLDKELFSRKTHPARKLIDILAKSSVGISDSSADEKYAKFADKIVQYVVENFTDDIGVFAAAVTKLEEFVEAELGEAEERADRVARSLNTKEQIVHAKMAVDEELNSRLEGRDVREFVRQFIKDYWRQLLIVTYIEEGADNDLWRSQLQTVDDLIWSITDKPVAAEKKMLAEKLPDLLRAIRAGMKTLDMDRKVCSKFLSMLASVHVVAVKNAAQTSLAEQRLASGKHPTDEPLQENIGKEDKQGFIKKGLERIFENKDLNEDEIELDQTLFDDDVIVEDVEPEILPTIKNLNKYLDMATSLDLGDWVEFDNEDGSSKRARFTWISPATGRYLFTNQKGQKTMDTTLGRLAELFSKEAARCIETQPDPLFDRAIGDLMGQLATA